LGRVYGYYRDSDDYHDFVKDGTTFIAVDHPGASTTSTQILSVNALGQFAGTYSDDSGIHGFVA
jgi:hypothetical protein